ncbi:heavy metal translocating P-type ATPase [Candidatus Peregrinibacteria bacterium]|nr:heavy metal translocating P-type ATPase [Candidatus Peregrinibacteria bacterium]
MENLTLVVSKMHCATCAQKIEKELSKTKGVLNVVVNFTNEQATITFDEQVVNEKKILRIITKLGYGAEINITENKKQKERKRAMKKLFVKLFFATTLALVALLSPFYITRLPNTISPLMIDGILFIVSLCVIYLGAYKTLYKSFVAFRELRLRPALLPGLGMSILIVYTLILILFPTIHSTLSRFTLLSTINVVSVVLLSIEWIKLSYEAQFKESYESLIEIQPKRARAVRHGTEMELDIEEIKIGEIIKVKAGETIPVDGIIIEGSGAINEMMIIGTINPVEKTIGDEVTTGTINGKNTLIIKTTQVGGSNTVNQLITHMKEAKKYPSFKEKNARVFEKATTIIFLLMALTLFIFWTLWGAPLYVGILSACSLLLISNPTLFRQSTDIPITYAIERLGLNGMIFSGGHTFEKAHKINHIAFDKTGILTKGVPEITNIVTKEGYNEKRFLILIGSLENASTHPFGEAIVRYVKEQGITIKKPSGIKTIEGMGILGVVDGQEVIAGNIKLLEKSNVQMNEELLHKAEILSKNVKTPVYVAKNRELIGVIGIADSIKDFSKEAIMMLRKGNYKLSLVTGDNKKIAEHIAETVRIKRVMADLIQHEKTQYIGALQDNNDTVAFVGNGINDAPVLAQADLGISAGVGNNIGLERSDLTILSDNLLHVDKALSTSKTVFSMMRNLFWFSMLYHVIVVVLVSGLTYPTFNIIMHPLFAPLIMGIFSSWMLHKISTIKEQTSFNF